MRQLPLNINQGGNQHFPFIFRAISASHGAYTTRSTDFQHLGQHSRWAFPCLGVRPFLTTSTGWIEPCRVKQKEQRHSRGLHWPESNMFIHVGIMRSPWLFQQGNNASILRLSKRECVRSTRSPSASSRPGAPRTWGRQPPPLLF